MQEATFTDTRRLLSGEELLSELFSEAARPSIRWLRDQQKRRTIAFVKVGRRVFFDPVRVSQDLATKYTVEARQ